MWYILNEWESNHRFYFNHRNYPVPGLNYFIRKIITNVQSTVQLVKNDDDDDSYTFTIVSTYKTTLLKFVPNVEFIEDTADGRQIKCLVTFCGNKMIQQQIGDNAIRIEREFSEDELITKCIYGDVVGTRWFKAIE